MSNSTRYTRMDRLVRDREVDVTITWRRKGWDCEIYDEEGHLIGWCPELQNSMSNAVRNALDHVEARVAELAA